MHRDLELMSPARLPIENYDLQLTNYTQPGTNLHLSRDLPARIYDFYCPLFKSKHDVIPENFINVNNSPKESIHLHFQSYNLQLRKIEPKQLLMYFIILRIYLIIMLFILKI